jgi:ADP-ribose pyrophosphatase YjhB (NUDIX family)
MAMVKKAMFMEGHVPKGGACISAFLVLKGKGGILVGKMAKPEIWVERFYMGEMFAPKYAASNKWLLPASHLEFGEKPEDAAKRVLTQQVGVPASKLTFRQIQSHLSQDPNDPEAAHWDLCFVYEGPLKGRVERPEWFSDLRFVNPKELHSDDFTRGHGDILKEFGLLKD